EADYLILGGGIMGQALAYNLWRTIESSTVLKASKHYGSTIAIVEQDPTLCQSATALAAGGIRSQFSNPANIQLSMLTAEFLREMKVHLSTVDNQEPDAQYQPGGYLVMATEAGASKLMKNYQTQIDTGAKIMLFTQDHLKETFPWMNVEGIELATFGLENEGWFDPMISHPRNLNFFFTFPNTTRCTQVKMAEHDKPIFIKGAQTIICCGAMSGEVARLAGVGTGNPEEGKYLEHEIPVEPRKRYIYVVHCPDAPMFDLPFVIDPSGVYCRRDGFGGKYICGMSPTEDTEPECGNFDVDFNFFDEEIWPRLAHRIPAFEKLKVSYNFSMQVTSAWAGYYEYNTYDQNGIIGNHPYHQNLHFLTGFSGHGIQQSFGASKALAEMIVNFETEHNIEPFSFNRIINNKPLLESNIF
uniref:FAD-dependent oxidoreductase domain-containing protein 1 n=1 Tax=Ciona savignyi TaxID=51511 RepID=H2Z1G5_CIOSA